MNSWPNISRTRVVQMNLILGLVFLAFAAGYVLLTLAGFNDSQPSAWFPVGFGAMGVLSLVNVSVMRRYDAQEKKAGQAGGPGPS
jgi:hypothetical protein